MEKLLSDRCAIVTGAGQGLGAAIAGTLAADGARVLVVSRRADRVDRTVAKIKERGGVAAGATIDLVEPGAGERAVEAAVKQFGGLDILVNCAGVFVWKKFLDLTPQDWDRTLATNLSAPFHLLQAAARVMISQGRGGAVVNIGSIHSRLGDPDVAAHCAAKFGLIGLSESAAAALREHDIRVNVICPGAIESDSADRRGSTPRQKVTQADIATLTSYLVSDLARSITGSAMDAFGSTRAAIKS